MNQKAIKPTIPSGLNTVLVGSQDSKTLSLVKEALSQTEIRTLSASNVNQLMLELFRNQVRVVVMDHSIAPGCIRKAVKDISDLCLRVGIIMIAQGIEDANAMDLAVGDCVLHLFTDIPSADHLRQFIFSTHDYLQQQSEAAPTPISLSRQRKSKSKPFLPPTSRESEQQIS